MPKCEMGPPKSWKPIATPLPHEMFSQFEEPGYNFESCVASKLAELSHWLVECHEADVAARLAAQGPAAYGPTVWNGVADGAHDALGLDSPDAPVVDNLPQRMITQAAAQAGMMRSAATNTNGAAADQWCPDRPLARITEEAGPELMSMGLGKTYSSNGIKAEHNSDDNGNLGMDSQRSLGAASMNSARFSTYTGSKSDFGSASQSLPLKEHTSVRKRSQVPVSSSGLQGSKLRSSGLSERISSYVFGKGSVNLDEYSPDSPRSPLPRPSRHVRISQETGSRPLRRVRLSGISKLSDRSGDSFGSLSMKDSGSGKKNPAVPKAVFADATLMKEKVRLALYKKEYNVQDFYHETGWAQKIGRSVLFEYFSLCVIFINSVWIAVDADNNPHMSIIDAEPIYQIAGHAFCIFFSLELTVRFLAFRHKRSCLNDAWFMFDSGLVILMVAETWVMALVMEGTNITAQSMGDTSVLKLVRLARLSRMARMARLLRAVPELIILIKGIGVASRSVFFTLVLLAILIYIFAIVMRELLDGTDAGERYFRTVPNGMASLLLDAVLPDQSPLVQEMANENVLFAIVILFFILGSTLTVMNMLVGVLCEVVNVVSKVEKETLTVTYLKQKMFAIFTDWQVDGNVKVGKDEFQRVLLMPEAARFINEIGVDVVGLCDHSEFLFREGQKLDFAGFMEMVLSFRGSNSCTVKDVVELRKFVAAELTLAKTDIILKLGTVMESLKRHGLTCSTGLTNSSISANGFGNSINAAHDLRPSQNGSQSQSMWRSKARSPSEHYEQSLRTQEKSNQYWKQLSLS